jgi:ketol-acid reductoisomerase
LDGERIAVLGYGNLGRSFALNLRDAGVRDLTVGNIEDAYAEKARGDGFPVQSVATATGGADLVLLMLPDEIIPEVYAKDVAPYLSANAALVVASGYCLAYRLVVPSVEFDVAMLAPRMGGEVIRSRNQQGVGFHAFLSVEQEASGKAWKRLLGLASAVGALRGGAFELNACSEANLDLFIEQTLGAIMGFSIMTAFSVGVDGGLPPEALPLEMYMSGEMEAVWRGFRTEGFQRSAATHGATAQFGGLLRTMQLFRTGVYEQFQKTFEEISQWFPQPQGGHAASWHGTSLWPRRPCTTSGLGKTVSFCSSSMARSCRAPPGGSASPQFRQVPRASDRNRWISARCSRSSRSRSSTLGRVFRLFHGG